MALEKLLTAKDIAERYGMSEKTATRYMRQMEHMEKPLRVTEKAVIAWEIGKLYGPKQGKETPARVIRAVPKPGEKFLIPRVRPIKASG